MASKEFKVGLVIFVIALLSIPVGLYNILYSNPFRLNIKGFAKYIPGFAFTGEGRLVYNWTLDYSKLEGRDIIMNISLSSGALDISESDDQALNIEIYSHDPNPNYNVETRELEKHLVINLHLSSGAVEITIDPSHLKSMKIKLNSGVADISLNTVRDADMYFDMNSGMLNIKVNYIRVKDTIFRIEVNSGFSNIDLDIPDDAKIYIEAEAFSGSVVVDSRYFSRTVTDEVAKYGDNVNADIKIISSVKSGFINLDIS